MIPFWFFILEDMISEDHEYFDGLEIPWVYIAYSVVVVVGPTLLGFGLQRLWPKVATLAVNFFKVLLTLLLLANIALVLWYNFDLLFMIDLRTAIGASLFIMSGYLCGCLTAVLARRGTAEVSVIAIETGIQNVFLAQLILDDSLTAPENDVSSIAALPVYITSHAQLAIVLLIRLVMNARKNKKNGRSRRPVHVYRCNSTPDDAEGAIQMVELNGNAAHVT